MKKLVKIFKYILVVILSFLAIICFLVFIQSKVSPNKIPSIFGYKPFIVLSGSMETEIFKGDLAIVKNVNLNSLHEKDIIAFRDENNHVVTHRIVSISKINGELEFVTKGDNNNTADDGIVISKDIEGKYVGKISGLGNVFLALQKPSTLFLILGIIVLFGVVWIVIGNSKLSIEERKELEQLRKEKNKD